MYSSVLRVKVMAARKCPSAGARLTLKRLLKFGDGSSDTGFDVNTDVKLFS